MRFLMGLAATFLLAGCVSDSELGANSKVLIAEENPILMTHPDFKGGTQRAERRLRKDVKNLFHARYSTAEADKGFASLMYFELYNRNYFPTKDANYYFKNWGLEGTKVVSNSQKFNTKLGLADYLLFELDDYQCMFLSKRVRGDRASLQGFYCFSQNAKIDSVNLGLIGDNLNLRY